jgi:SSS family solute:Na+ symporter
MLAVILLGFLTKHVSALAAKVSLVLGPILFYLLVFSFGDSVQTFLKNLFGTEDDIHFLHFLAFVFLLTIVLMLFLSHFRPNAHEYEQTYTGDVDITPWKHARTVGLVISLVTITIYVLLAQ